MAKAWTKLPAPLPGTKGHFDHHEGLEKKINDLKADLDDLVIQVAALKGRVTTLESKVP